MEPQDPESLEKQVAELRLRVARLEEALVQTAVARRDEAPSPTVAQSKPVDVSQPPAAKAQEIPAPALSAAFPVAPPQFGILEAAPAAEARSLESRVGSQWFNRIGILAILTGMAWFLKFAIDNHWIGPLGRVLIGLIAGAGLIAWSERFRGRGYAAFAFSLKAAGSGILYLSLWAAFSLYHLIPGTAAFAAMILVTAFNGYLAWAQNSELLAVYAIAGGLSTPLLVSTGENHEIALFGYLLMLDAAVLLLVIWRPWSRLLVGAFAGTVLFVAGWWFSFYSQAQAGRTAFFLACFFLAFAFAPRLARFNLQDGETPAGWDNLALALLPVANAALGFLGFYLLLDRPAAEWAGPWLAVAFAAFYLLLLRLRGHGRLHESPALLSSLHLASAVVFLTIAIPLKAHGRWLTIGWLVEGAALLWASIRADSKLLRTLALICLELGLCALLLADPRASTLPILNARFGAYLAAIAVYLLTAYLAHHAPPESGGENPLSWPAIAAAALLHANALVLLAFGWEIHSFWWNRAWHGQQVELHDYQMYAQFTYSAFFMIFGAILLSLGFWRRSAFLRWQALVLLAVSIGKVFVIDVNALSQGFRIVSFLGLGALLLGVSFVYQRDWLNLRSRGGRTV